MIHLLRNKYEFQWGEQHSLFSAEYWAESYGSYALGRPKRTDFVMLVNHGYVNTYSGKGMLVEWQSRSTSLLNDKVRRRILRKSCLARRRYNAYFRRLYSINITQIGNENLFILLKNYRSILCEVANLFVVSQPEGIHAVTEKLQRLLQEQKMEHNLYALVTPTKMDIINRERCELATLGRKRTVTRRDLIRHAYRHAWLFFNSYDTSINLAYLRKRLHGQYDQKRKRDELLRLRRRQKTVFSHVKSRLLVELARFLQTISLERLELKNCWSGAEYRFLPVLSVIASRIGMSLPKMLATYRFDDYRTFLIKGKRLNKIDRLHRLVGYALYNARGKIKFTDRLREIQYLHKRLQRPSVQKTVRNIHGVTANPGRVIGTCRIVPSQDITSVMKHLKHFRSGDILVTWMTQPNMMPIAQRASAIIADEGGITSHAAVISREFNIPCVVGTKIATKVLKDGDRVEVDANKGLIRKI